MRFFAKQRTKLEKPVGQKSTQAERFQAAVLFLFCPKKDIIRLSEGYGKLPDIILANVQVFARCWITSSIAYEGFMKVFMAQLSNKLRNLID